MIELKAKKFFFKDFSENSFHLTKIIAIKCINELCRWKNSLAWKTIFFMTQTCILRSKEKVHKSFIANLA